ncbi:MAG: GNAT family N-acetyltransferase [Pseudomonadota bacterium]
MSCGLFCALALLRPRTESGLGVVLLMCPERILESPCPLPFDTSTITLRRARLDEADALSDLIFRAKAAIGYDDAFMEAVREDMVITREDIEGRELWVAEREAVLGCGSLALLPDGVSGEIKTMFIEPGVKRGGIGTLLLEHLFARAQSLGLSRLELEAEPTAVPFYEKHGFVVFGDSPSTLIEGRSLPLMQRDLGQGK